MQLSEGSWSRILFAVAGALAGTVAFVHLTNATAATNFATTTSVRPQVGQFTNRVSQVQSSARLPTYLSAVPRQESVEYTTDATSSVNPTTVGAVAAVSAVFGALAMKIWGERNAPEYDVEAAAASTPFAFRTTSPFTGSSLNIPDFSQDARSSRLVLQAAKAGKGKGGGGGKGKIAGIIKLALPAGKATPAPPVGPALGQYGLNIVAFCKEYNAATEKDAADGMIIPVEITAMEDRSYTFVLKTPPASVLLRKAAGVPKGSSTKDKVGTVTRQQLEDIARTKLPDLNTPNVEAAMKIVAGTARSMGITIEA